MFIAFIRKLCIFNNFELMTFYHVQGPKSCNFNIDKNRFKKANMSVFQCHLFISNGIHQVHMKLLILDQLQWVNFAACTQRPVMITGEVSHGSPFIKPI